MPLAGVYTTDLTGKANVLQIQKMRVGERSYRLSVLNRTTCHWYTREQRASLSARRSLAGLTVRSLVHQALRGLKSPLLAEPGAKAPGSECANAVGFDLG